MGLNRVYLAVLNYHYVLETLLTLQAEPIQVG